MVSLYSVVLLSLLLVLVRIYAFTKLQSVFHCRWNTQTNKYLKNNQKSIFKSALQAKRDFSPPTPTYNDDNTIEKSSNNGLVYTVDLPRRAGIEWGSDLSFRWIYVRGLEEGGEAERSGVIQKGDYIVSFGNTSTIGQDFDFVLSTLTKQPATLNYTFFRGTKAQLIGEDIPDPRQTTFSVTVLKPKQGGTAGELETVVVPCVGGTTLRNLLLGNGINVYRSLTRFTNCNGKQRCGTCIVEMTEGSDKCSRKSLDEEMVLRENPDSYRLSCITQVYGDATVQVMGPVGAAQWTR